MMRDFTYNEVLMLDAALKALGVEQIRTLSQALASDVFNQSTQNMIKNFDEKLDQISKLKNMIRKQIETFEPQTKDR